MSEEMSNAWKRPKEYLNTQSMQTAAYAEYMDTMERAVLESIGKGVTPWAPDANEAINASTGRVYRGDNGIMLTAVSNSRFGGDPRYFTASDIRAMGLKVREGEQGIPAFYYEGNVFQLKTDEEGNVLRDSNGNVVKEPVKLEHKVFRPYLLFNAQQIEGDVPAYRKEFYPNPYRTIDRTKANALLHAHGTSLFRAIDLENRKEELAAKGVRFKADGMIDFSDRQSVSNVYFDAMQRTLLRGRNPEEGNLGLITEIAAARICDRLGMNPKVPASDKRADQFKQVVSEAKGFSNILKRADAMAFYFRNPNLGQKRKQEAEKKAEKVADMKKLWSERAAESVERVKASRRKR